MWWTKDSKAMWAPEYEGKALCSECGPPTYIDGSKTKFGKWHGRFPKRPAVGMLIDQNGNLCSQEQIDHNQLPHSYSIVGKVEGEEP
jgi:hypothetical protein